MVGPMEWLSGKTVADARTPGLRTRLDHVRARLARAPHLKVFLVGEDPASQIYVEMKRKRGLTLGVKVELIALPAAVGAAGLWAQVSEANHDPSVDGILIQRPLPFDVPAPLPGLQEWVAAEKDVDAFHPVHLGRLGQGSPLIMACTPAGIMALLEHFRVPLEGKLACVVGRSPLVGQPMGLALLNKNATLIQCHRRTEDLARLTAQADLLVVAAGSRGLIGRAHVKPGAVVVDVGIHRDAAGGIVGDVLAEEVRGVASRLTPVPGGVGPLTVHFLFENLVTLIEAKLDTRRP
jgi:methylenetetrahydrofolate dehydrogenase (NADP+)/methenyltetrahydrofolate cyclohydrolase